MYLACQNMVTVPGLRSGCFLMDFFLVDSYLSFNSSLNGVMKPF